MYSIDTGAVRHCTGLNATHVRRRDTRVRATIDAVERAPRAVLSGVADPVTVEGLIALSYTNQRASPHNYVFSHFNDSKDPHIL